MKRTPYCEVLKEMGGKFVDFAGFDMPVQFDSILAEHKAVREGVGIFDVSHMGEFLFAGEGALPTLQQLLCNNYESLQEGRVRYSPMLNPEGGVIDDVLVYCIGKGTNYMMCVNASNKDKDRKWIEENLLPNTDFKDVSEQTAQLAVQGPLAEKVIGGIFKAEDIPEKYYSFKVVDCGLNIPVILSRTGYTAEDGFEIYMNANDAIKMLFDVLDAGKDHGIKLCGLGARDTLRLEGAMPLYGHEMDDSTLATELGLDSFIKLDKPSFIGKDALAFTAPKMKRVGLKIVGRGIAREHAEVYADGKLIGSVSSGTHSPTLGYPIAMARIDKAFDGKSVEVDVRGKRLAAEIVALPFYKRQK